MSERNYITPVPELIEEVSAAIGDYSEWDKRTGWKVVATVQDLAARLARAERSLTSAGFTDLGGEAWKPPVNEAAGDAWRKLIAAEARLAEAERDAARYRWLRDKSRCFSPHMDGSWNYSLGHIKFPRAVSFDDAVDAALAGDSATAQESESHD